MTEIQIERMKRRLEKRDKKIAGLERKVQQLERALATRTVDLESLSRNMEDTVQRALCNVRMIPVTGGFVSGEKIVEVRNITTKESQRAKRR